MQIFQFSEEMIYTLSDEFHPCESHSNLCTLQSHFFQVLFFKIQFSGHYMLMDARGRTKGDIARLYTETLPSTNGSCMSLYAKLPQGDGGSSFFVKINNDLKDSSGSYQLLYTLSGVQGADWVSAQVSYDIRDWILQ